MYHPIVKFACEDDIKYQLYDDTIQFLEMSEISVAVRFDAGQFQVEDHKTPNGKPFQLINIPYFLAEKLGEYLELYLRNTIFVKHNC